MSERAKHTPGPWATERVTSLDSLVYCRVGPASELAKSRSVAYAGTYGKLPDGSTSPIRLSEAECEANARLIAAAPELLEALEEARFELWRALDHLHVLVPEDTSAMQKIDAALAKARGQ